MDLISHYLKFYVKGLFQLAYVNLYFNPYQEKLMIKTKEENNKIITIAKNLLSKPHVEIQYNTYDMHDKNKPVLTTTKV